MGIGFLLLILVLGTLCNRKEAFAGYDCPKGWSSVENPNTQTCRGGRCDKRTCCKPPNCSGFKCSVGQLLENPQNKQCLGLNDEGEGECTEADCCSNTCQQHECNNDNRLIPSNLCPASGCTDAYCCENNCSGWFEDGEGECPKHLSNVQNPETTSCGPNGCSVEQCCVPQTCSDWSGMGGECGWGRIVTNPENVQCLDGACDESKCCLNTCAKHSCSQGELIPNNPCGPGGCNDDYCCSNTCAKFVCDEATEGTLIPGNSCGSDKCSAQYCCAPPTCGNWAAIPAPSPEGIWSEWSECDPISGMQIRDCTIGSCSGPGKRECVAQQQQQQQKQQQQQQVQQQQIQETFTDFNWEPYAVDGSLYELSANDLKWGIPDTEWRTANNLGKDNSGNPVIVQFDALSSRKIINHSNWPFPDYLLKGRFLWFGGNGYKPAGRLSFNSDVPLTAYAALIDYGGQEGMGNFFFPEGFEKVEPVINIHGGGHPLLLAKREFSAGEIVFDLTAESVEQKQTFLINNGETSGENSIFGAYFICYQCSP